MRRADPFFELKEGKLVSLIDSAVNIEGLSDGES